MNYLNDPNGEKPVFREKSARIIYKYIKEHGQGKLCITTNTEQEKELYVESIVQNGIGYHNERVKIDHKTSIATYRIKSVKTLKGETLFTKE